MSVEQQTVPVPGAEFSFFSTSDPQKSPTLIQTVGETLVAGAGVSVAGEERFALYDGRKTVQLSKVQARDLAALLSTWAGVES